MSEEPQVATNEEDEENLPVGARVVAVHEATDTEVVIYGKGEVVGYFKIELEKAESALEALFAAMGTEVSKIKLDSGEELWTFEATVVGPDNDDYQEWKGDRTERVVSFTEI